MRDRQRRPAEVERAGARIAALGDQDEAGDQRDGDDRDVEPEHRAPGEPLEQQAADERAEADSDARDRRPDPDRLAALLAREDVDDHRQRGGHDHRPADAHRRPQHDQLRRILRERGEHAGDAEEHEPGLQGPLAAEAVAERAHREQDAGEGEQIRVDDPLQRGARRREVGLQRRQRDVEHRVVEPDDEQAEGEDAERLPAALVHLWVGRCGLHGGASAQGIWTRRTGIARVRGERYGGSSASAACRSAASTRHHRS